ncbi:hypothetical protein IVA80_30755 [Bradyrhizobium sp. 139]|uniref:hypothetical protein n=1 Tax=Bradyrhizobium sp. 139 TaxID=2782616 RepID=UPI001FFAFC7F|nr:hypothetical protein [Bradyrhizobium sp. 139]MCK1745080.1 hypothetical protein [Bradyrhizobium sp. 139]
MRKVLAARVVAQAVQQAARALVPAAQVAVAPVPAVLEPAAQATEAEPELVAAAASRMSSGADKVPPVLEACATRRLRLPMATRRVASRFTVRSLRERALPCCAHKSGLGEILSLPGPHRLNAQRGAALPI